VFGDLKHGHARPSPVNGRIYSGAQSGYESNPNCPGAAWVTEPRYLIEPNAISGLEPAKSIVNDRLTTELERSRSPERIRSDKPKSAGSETDYCPGHLVLRPLPSLAPAIDELACIGGGLARPATVPPSDSHCSTRPSSSVR
jgi:hypothetical protein